MREIDRLLQRLGDAAATPLEQATAMPPELYRSPELLELERERIFAREWLCPGRAADIPDPGDYVTFSINDQPVFVIRAPDGGVRGFSNVCLHRMMRLLDGAGNARRIVCPYHGWSYDLEGCLAGAPHMGRTLGWQPRDLCLPAIRTEVWEGWIYVTLNREAPSVSDQLRPLHELVARYAMADYVPIVTQDHVWRTNWKQLTENFMESYHLPVAHRKTLGTWLPVDEVGFPDDVHDAFTYETFTKDETARYGRAHPANTRLDGRWRYTSVMPTVYPTHMYVVAPDHLWYLSLRPRTVGEVRVRFGAALAPEVMAGLEDREAGGAQLIEVFDRLKAEERFVVEGLYEGAQAPLARPGRVSWLEREIHDFIGYLARRLTPDWPARPPASTGSATS